MSERLDPFASGRRPLVLIVDDYLDGRLLTAELLQLDGFETAEAETGPLGLEKAIELQPDAILMDLSLPEMNGWEVIRRLKQDPRTRECPVIAYTAHAVDSMLERAELAGCDAVLTKPCRPSALVEALQSAMASRPRITGQALE